MISAPMTTQAMIYDIDWETIIVTLDIEWKSWDIYPTVNDLITKLQTDWYDITKLKWPDWTILDWTESPTAAWYPEQWTYRTPSWEYVEWYYTFIKVQDSSPSSSIVTANVTMYINWTNIWIR